MIWVQYTVGAIGQDSTLDHALTGADLDNLTAAGRAQIEYDGDPTGMAVDATQDPPVVIPAQG